MGGCLRQSVDALENLSRAALVLEHHGLVASAPNTADTAGNSHSVYGRRQHAIEGAVRVVRELVCGLMRKDAHICNAMEHVGRNGRANEELWVSLEQGRPSATQQKTGTDWVDQIRAELAKAEAKAALEWEQIEDELDGLLQMVAVGGKSSSLAWLLSRSLVRR